MANDLNMMKYLKEIRGNSHKMMKQLGNNSKNFFQVKNWEAQGFIDRSTRRWQPVKNKPPGQKILVVTGRLRRSARSYVTSRTRARVEFSAPYASYVNADRQFIGNSARLDKENEKIIRNFMTKIFSKTLR